MSRLTTHVLDTANLMLQKYRQEEYHPIFQALSHREC